MIINENQLNSIRKQLGGKRVVVVCGIYDLLHVGHIRFLQKAKELGDILIVGTPRDDYIKTFKGANRPINSSEERAELLNSLESVDYVIEGDSKYISLALQSSIKPDFYAYCGTLRDGLPAKLKFTSPSTQMVEFPEENKSRWSSTSLLERGNLNN
jgi:rfaE bifunctional protein nucleotidyltransferase chain/domain